MEQPAVACLRVITAAVRIQMLVVPVLSVLYLTVIVLIMQSEAASSNT